MRDIIFRGKRIDNGEWIYGVPLVGSTRLTYIISSLEKCDVHDCEYDCHAAVDYLVDPETVGQYIGCTDENKAKIFEGDIVLTDEGGWKAEVIFGGGDFYCVDHKGGYSTMCNWNQFEVIGNIYEDKPVKIVTEKEADNE